MMGAWQDLQQRSADMKRALLVARRIQNPQAEGNFLQPTQDGLGQPAYLPEPQTGTHFGFHAISGNDYATAYAAFAKALGPRSTAGGAYAEALDEGCTSWGYQARAVKARDTAMGAGCVVSGGKGTGLGQALIATGSKNTAVGQGSSVSGDDSIVVGVNTTVTHDDAIAIGNDLTSTEDGEILIGSRFKVDSTGDIYVDGVNVTEQLAAVMGLPFEGVLGSGLDGEVSITSTATATNEVPIYQTTTFSVSNGVTWTAYSNNPGGFIISVQNRCTIAGIINVNGLGASGGQQVTTQGNGYNGEVGYHFAGSGGGGGASASMPGGHGAPLYKEFPYGNYNPGGSQRTSAHADSWYGVVAAAPDEIDLRRESASNTLNGGNGALTSAVNGSAGASVNAFAGMPELFPMLWSLFRSQLLGWGGGGGSGGHDSTAGSGGEGGAGGNGGGCLIILCDELDFTGTINASGEAGENGGAAAGGSGDDGGGGGGGGGGGCVIIGYRTLIANTGTVSVNGGSAGTGGAGDGAGSAGSNGAAGGAGFSKIFAMRI